MKNSNLINRRNFINQTAFASGALLLPLEMVSSNIFENNKTAAYQLDLHIFSKHLQFLDYKNMCEAAKEMGFNGLDLTVRPKGHVLPENVVEDLPKATEFMKLYDLSPRMISTSVIDTTNQTQKLVVETAKKLGYEIYRTDWIKYNRNNTVLDNLNIAKIQLNELAIFNHNVGITGAYQNHSGHYVGSSMWGLQQVIDGISPLNLGSQYDIVHAMIEGGKNWEIGFELIKPYINSLVLKDFKWEKINGKWDTVFTPMGEGMIDFHYYFSLLKKHNIQVPISLHVEYDLGGAEKGGIPTIDNAEIFNRIKKDVHFINKVWEEVNN
jgi:sugar phosphate isomerase/epimerase